MRPMRAMVREAPRKPFSCGRAVPIPIPTADQILPRVHSCGVCRTDLHSDGELPKLPLIPGQIVGSVEGHGQHVRGFCEATTQESAWPDRSRSAQVR